jgi:hypothetical protein
LLEHATGRARQIAGVAVAVAVVGVFVTWTTDGTARLDGTQGPHDGWLVVILAAFALAWARMLASGSWIGVVGVLGSGLVIGWTALESWLDGREVLDASARLGLVLVLAASIVLVGIATLTAVELVRARRVTAGLDG